MLNIQRPETTTVIRWLLRVILVVFLAWLVQRRPEEEEEEEEVTAAQSSPRRPSSTKSRAPGARTIARLQPRRDPYPATVRQRRVGQANESADFDAVIEKVSKPKEMWEARKSGEPPQILRRDTPQAAGGTGAGGKSIVREVKGNSNVLHGHERPVTFITWNRDCNLLFTCGKDKIVCVWNCPEGECLGTYNGHSGAVWACSVTVDSRWLVTSGADRLVIVWEARTSRELARVELPGVVRFVEWSGGGSSPSASPPVSERFVTCHNRFGAHPPAVTIWRFDGTAIEELLRISRLPTAATQVRWGRGDYFVASAHENGELVFWRADTGAEVRRLKAHSSSIAKFDFSSDRELVATASHDMSVRIWDIGKGSEWKKLYSAETDRPLNAVALGPVTRTVAMGSPSQRPTRCCVIAAGGQDVRDVTRSSSTTEQFGTLLFCMGSAQNLPCELKAEGVTKGHFGPVHTLAFAWDGSAIASGSEDGCIRLHFFDSGPARPPSPATAASKQDEQEEEAVPQSE